MLPLEEFKNIIKYTPLVAIDFIIQNSDGNILLGKRKNNPAKDYLFVPGGRIFKNESFDRAIERISINEMGISLKKSDVELIGVYDHIHDENYFKDDSFNTQYIVIACKAILSIESISTTDQHDEILFMKKDELLKSPRVHQFTKNYFLDDLPPNQF